MTNFDTSWTFSGATATLRLTLTDPTIAPGQTSATVTATLTLITNGAVSDSSNSNSLSGSIVHAPHAVSVSHAAYPVGGSTNVGVGSGVFGNSTTVSVTGTISGYDAFPGTHTVSGSVFVPAYIPTATVPGVPGTAADTIQQTSVRIVVTAPASNGGAAIDSYETYVLTNNAWPDAGGTVIASAYGGTFTTPPILYPLTTYYYTSRAHNSVGYSGWTPMRVVTTRESGMVNVGGTWRQAAGYANVAGTWHVIQETYANVGGTWHTW